VIGPAIADAVTGQYAAMGILAALLERAQTGKGRRLDISMLEAMCHFNLDSFTHYYSVGEVMGPLSRPVCRQSYTFECADGKWVAIHMSSPPKFWEGFLERDRPEHLATDPRFAERLERIRHQDDLIAHHDAGLSARKPATPGARRWKRPRCRTAPPMTATRRWTTRRPVHLRIKVSAPSRRLGTFTTVRAPYNFDGEPGRRCCRRRCSTNTARKSAPNWPAARPADRKPARAGAAITPREEDR
jgi:crotonobetainyl-CoA:carnitine CoA-transferase CaiB-like acyl-CoA transferase